MKIASRIVPFLLHIIIQVGAVDAIQSDWVLAPNGDDCHQACSVVGGACNVEAINRLNSADRLRFVDSLVGGRCDDFSGGILWGNEPSYYDPRYCVFLNPGEVARCDFAVSGESKYCCCGSNCPIEEHHWVLADAGVDCNQACQDHTTAGSGTCNADAMSNLNSVESADFVGSLIGINCEEYQEGVVYGNEPSTYSVGGNQHCVYPEPGGTITCEASLRSEQRICCCGELCPTSNS